MRIEKHLDALKEVLDEIESAVKDPKGLLSHQRRIALIISLGIATLVEIYFHKLNIMKQGSSIKHEWLKKADSKEMLSRQITASIDTIDKIDDIIRIAKKIEQKRNDLAYGSPVDDEQILFDQINLFFDIKKIIENVIGDIL